MSSTASWRTFVSVLASAAALLAGCATSGNLLYADDFRNISQWVVESEQPASVTTHAGVLDIDSPAGLTLWFKPKLEGPLEIVFEAKAVDAGGPNDQVSDLNVFWMAHNNDGVEPIYSKPRRGRFAEYNDMLTYYVGLGGNRNTTTRFRRYIGDPQLRPLLREHDLAAPALMLIPNEPQSFRLVANGRTIEYWRDGDRLFQFQDDAPYTAGWFALRTTWSHLQIRKLRIRRLDD